MCCSLAFVCTPSAHLFPFAVPPNTVGVASIKMHLEVWGQRKYAGDKRLDWLFTERREKNVEKSKQEKALKEVIAKQEGEEEADFLERMKKKGLQGAEGEKKGSGGGGEKGGKAETVQVRRAFRSSFPLLR